MGLSLKRRRRRNNMGQSQNQMFDKNERFVLRHTADLLIRHLDRYPALDEEILELICWNLGDSRENLSKCLLEQFEEDDREDIEEELSESVFDYREYGDRLWHIVSRMLSGFHRKMIRETQRLLTLKIDELRYRGKSNLEKKSGRYWGNV